MDNMDTIDMMDRGEGVEAGQERKNIKKKGNLWEYLFEKIFEGKILGKKSRLRSLLFPKDGKWGWNARGRS